MGACGSVAEWLGRWTCDQQVVGSNPSHPVVECNPGQVVNTRVPLSPSSIIWYRLFNSWLRLRLSSSRASRHIGQQLDSRDDDPSQCVLPLPMWCWLSSGLPGTSAPFLWTSSSSPAVVCNSNSFAISAASAEMCPLLSAILVSNSFWYWLTQVFLKKWP